MKKRLWIVIGALVVIIFTVVIIYLTSYPTINIIKMVGTSSDNFEKEFHSEIISIASAGIGSLPDSPLQKKKTDAIMEWSNAVSLELAEYVKLGGTAYNIIVTGEIENGKTTLRYEGYIIDKSGKKIDYKQEKTFDFVVCSEKRFLT